MDDLGVNIDQVPNHLGNAAFKGVHNNVPGVL